MHALRQWILCWYLIGFCSVAQIAKALGISPEKVMQIVSLGNEINLLPSEKSYQATSKMESSEKAQKQTVEQQEDYTRSASKAPLKPGYKSKK